MSQTNKLPTRTEHQGIRLLFLIATGATMLSVSHAFAQEILPFPPTPSASTAGRTVEESTHQKRVVPSRLPDDAPNILIVLIDDVGPGQTDTYGGDIHTPALSRIAKEGISFNRFHSTAMCSPTRAALLTGRNHHRVGSGQITEFANDWDGYAGIIPRSSATVAEVLRQYGYATSAFGKWHNTPVTESSEMGPFDHWPTGYGFEHFYGFLGGEASQYEPKLVRNTTLVDQSTIHRDGYHLSEDLADEAISWLQKHQALQPEKPFLMYWASGAAHGPHHVTKEWADKYKGKFDDGWDVARSRIFENAKAKGWIPPETKLTDRHPSMPAWDSIPEDERAFQVRLMEVYAGFIEHVDTQVGRLFDEVDRLNYKDNTIVFYIWGDNGASAEGQYGTIAELLSQNGIVASAKEQMAAIESIGGLDALGGPKVENMAHAGWAWAGGSPYQSTKLVSAHFGGSRQPMAIRWPKGIKPDSTPRSQFHHVNDIAPTIYDLLDINPPLMVNGVQQLPIDGVSMQYTFDDAKADSKKLTQYFEIYASRGIYHEGWFAGAFGPRIPWVPGYPEGFDTWTPDKDQWELYNIDEDWSQANDLAKEMPEKLAAMKDIFLIEAARNNVLPVGAAFWSTGAMHPEDAPSKPTTSWNYPVPITGVPELVAPRLGSRPSVVTVKLDCDRDASGVLYSIGSFAGGLTVFVDEGVLKYEYNLFLLDRTRITASQKLPRGEVEVEIVSTFEKPGLWAPMDVVLKVNGKEVGQGRVPKTAPSLFSFNDGFDIGQDLGSPVSDTYYEKAPFKFDGTIGALKANYLK